MQRNNNCEKNFYWVSHGTSIKTATTGCIFIAQFAWQHSALYV